MRKGTDALLAIGSIALVTIVPTVLVLLPSGKDDSDPGHLPDPAAAQLNGPISTNTSPVPTFSAPTVNGNPAPTNPNPLPTLNVPPVTGTPAPRKTTPPVYLPSDDGSKITGVKWLDKRKTQADITVNSTGLGKSVKVRLLVPKTWSATATRTWPTLYAFHGGNDTYISWTRSTDIESLAAKYDTLVAMPDGGRNGSYTDWYNGGRGGTPRWETFHTVEVRELLERNFRAGPERAAIGISSGAQGAITYAARHPGLYRFAGSFSGVLSMLSPGIPALLLYTNARPGTTPSDIWGDPVLNRANWAAHDPATLLPRLRWTKVYVSSGNGSTGPYDNPNAAPWDIRYLSESQVYRTSKDFVAQARRLGVPVTTDFYGNGSHSWKYWQDELHKTFPQIMTALGARKL
ncbi:Diacylglycerol acyltransferase/mycolyltransferase Ag85B precursor [Actinomadura rubteroloni]|uniref:Diacylglycerol acyltransferase/mycolyltransferase Ag85B n=1 Tax=Actinomadura rubteroloni TaxID=1926885 RepID=A0A2P4UQG7_9ACTN|nr:alpha/beta hydrolase family protein [Actinomadura rubteroloni]POM27286.1 Diacylglycerol acyltransferase/mycolyltransferase Ag85B precursor [Actinomadura rubteroloni]